MTKNIFVTGGVLSSVGKGVVVSSIGKMLQARGFRATAVKIDPYVNVDAGTMNPLMHGEVFVTEDGGETDLDLGWYERMLDVNMSKEHYITTGQIYGAVIERERRGDYLGKCVQIVPHITDEIKRRIRQVAQTGKYDVIITEIGGTTGDIEGLPFLEAIRQMKLEGAQNDTLFVHVALVPILDVTKEQKTKPLQHSVNELRRIGVQPDIIVARCDTMVDEESLQKIALFTSINHKGVLCSPTVECIYELPLTLDEQNMGEYIREKIGLPNRKPDWSEWKTIVQGFLNPEYQLKIALCGKYSKLADSYVSINEAIRHAAAMHKAKVNIDWIETEMFEDNPNRINMLSSYDGILVPPGFGARGTEGKILAIKFARENDIPFLGVCFGFQMAIIEFARSVCKLHRANSMENDPETPYPVLVMLPEQKGLTILGGTMRLGAHEVSIVRNTLTHSLYQSDLILGRHRHRYEVNPEYWGILQNHGLLFTGKSMDGQRIEILEFPKNLFHLGAQFHPEFKSRPGKPEPLYDGFIKACLKHNQNKRKS